MATYDSDHITDAFKSEVRSEIRSINRRLDSLHIDKRIDTLDKLDTWGIGLCIAVTVMLWFAIAVDLHQHHAVCAAADDAGVADQANHQELPDPASPNSRTPP